MSCEMTFKLFKTFGKIIYLVKSLGMCYLYYDELLRSVLLTKCDILEFLAHLWGASARGFRRPSTSVSSVSTIKLLLRGKL